MKIGIIIFFTINFLFLGCKKEDIREDMDIPFISIKSVSPTIIQEFSQNVLLEIAYEDGNGDLGFQNPDSLSLSVQDSRLNYPDMYHIPPLAPIGENIYIKGTFNISLNSTFLIGGSGGSEKLYYTVKIKDRAENWSNVVNSEEITITGTP